MRHLAEIFSILFFNGFWHLTKFFAGSIPAAPAQFQLLRASFEFSSSILTFYMHISLKALHMCFQDTSHVHYTSDDVDLIF